MPELDHTAELSCVTEHTSPSTKISRLTRSPNASLPHTTQARSSVRQASDVDDALDALLPVALLVVVGRSLAAGPATAGMMSCPLSIE